MYMWGMTYVSFRKNFWKYAYRERHIGRSLPS